jgi:ribosomal protein L5
MPFKKPGNLSLGLKIMVVLKLTEGLKFSQASIEVMGILICMRSKQQKLDEELRGILITMRKF